MNNPTKKIYLVKYLDMSGKYLSPEKYLKNVILKDIIVNGNTLHQDKINHTHSYIIDKYVPVYDNKQYTDLNKTRLSKLFGIDTSNIPKDTYIRYCENKINSEKQSLPTNFDFIYYKKNLRILKHDYILEYVKIGSDPFDLYTMINYNDLESIFTKSKMPIQNKKEIVKKIIKVLENIALIVIINSMTQNNPEANKFIHNFISNIDKFYEEILPNRNDDDVIMEKLYLNAFKAIIKGEKRFTSSFDKKYNDKYSLETKDIKSRTDIEHLREFTYLRHFKSDDKYYTEFYENIDIFTVIQELKNFLITLENNYAIFLEKDSKKGGKVNNIYRNTFRLITSMKEARDTQYMIEIKKMQEEYNNCSIEDKKCQKYIFVTIDEISAYRCILKNIPVICVYGDFIRFIAYEDPKEKKTFIVSNPFAIFEKDKEFTLDDEIIKDKNTIKDLIDEKRKNYLSEKKSDENGHNVNSLIRGYFMNPYIEY